MATPNEYGMVWMSPSHMLMPPGQGGMQLMHPSETFQPSEVFQSSDAFPSSEAYSSEMLQPMEMEGFLMCDNYEPEFCDEPPRYMTAATQTATSHNRKIKPVKHPGLKLQTPIAYKCDTDPSVIPIQKDGMAICEKCGAIGVKHSFYTRHRKYCSLACARGSLGLTDAKDEVMNDDENSQNSQNSQGSQTEKQMFKYPNGVEINEETELITKEAIPLTIGPPTMENIPSFPSNSNVAKFPFPKLELPIDDPVPPIQSKKTKQELANTYNWNSKFVEPGFLAVPVSCFRHAPMSDCWDNITVGMKVEVENRDCDDYSEAFPDCFWVATVLRVAGYKALLRYEGFGQNNEKDFWVNLCCNHVRPVGCGATRGKPLIPPKTIADKYKDWKEFLKKRLTGARTLPTNFYSKVHDSMKSRFRIGLNVEVVDKNRISQVCVATVKRIVGKRLHVEYYNADSDDNGFWCHEDSPLIHPVGWASRVGHLIDAPDDYIDRCESGLIEKDDATEELFTAPHQASVANRRDPSLGRFEEGMKLEAIDPLNLSSICVATVMKVLRDDYLMIRIDSYPPDATGADWFCYHSSSPCIFPPGFCHKNMITLIPPKDYDKSEFNWDSYIAETNAVLAPESLFEKEIPDHGIEVGMRLEAADLMDPRLVCVGTVSRVVGRLLKIHFDGWEEEYDQWLDCDSPDVYPVGWCDLVGHKLEGPRCPQKPNMPLPPKRRGPRKRIRSKQKNSPPNKKSISLVEISPEAKKVLNFDGDVKSEMDSGSLNRNDKSSLSVSVNSGIHDGNSRLTKEPEMGREPSGPDQSLPTSTVNTKNESSSVSSSKYIPRLIDSSLPIHAENGVLNPSEWDCQDVVQFLKMNDCSSYADNFIKQRTDGKTLLSLTKDQIMDMIGFKIGPTVKIYDLIQQLKNKANKANMKKII